LKQTSFSLRADDGCEIFVYQWLGTEARAALQIAHGLAEHAGRYARTAERLVAAGYAVYANDHRGHGRTARGRHELGALAEAGGWDRVVADLALLNARIQADHPGLPVALLGHSLGSFMLQHYLGEHGDSIAAAVLSGSTKLGPIPGTTAPADRDPFAALNAPFAPARTPFDWLSRDAAEVDRYIADPLCGFQPSAATLAALAQLPARLYDPAALARIPPELPIYVFSGDRDPVHADLAGLHALLETYRAAGLRNVLHRFYAGGRHEMLNETNRDEVTSDLIRWLGAALG